MQKFLQRRKQFASLTFTIQKSVKETEKHSKDAAHLSDFQSSHKGDNSPSHNTPPKLFVNDKKFWRGILLYEIDYSFSVWKNSLVVQNFTFYLTICRRKNSIFLDKLHRQAKKPLYRFYGIYSAVDRSC